MMLRRLFLLLGALLAAAPAAAADQDSAALWRRLQTGGHVVLMRHAATVSGIGDPAGFKLGDCTTQRNLSQAGRTDAAAIGAAFRAHKVPVEAVLSSRWCRCLDTARIAFGRVDPSPMLDSMFTEGATASAGKLEQVRTYLAGSEHAGKHADKHADKQAGNLVFVTHDVNIRALVGRYLSQGEMVVAVARADGSLSVAGVLSVDEMRAGSPR